MPQARNFDYQDPIKNKINRETNQKYGGNDKPKRGKNYSSSRPNINHDYHTSAWEKLISKTQN